MNIFKQLAEGVTSEVEVKVIKEGVQLELHGTLEFNKGGLKRTKTWYSRTYEKSDGLISMDDWDGDWQEASFNGVNIDSYDKFLQGFKDHGMETIAKSLEITDDEVNKAIFQAVVSHKWYKAVYKKAKLYQLLTEDERKQHYYPLAISGKNIGLHMMRAFGWVDDNGVAMTPQQVEEFENKLLSTL